MAVEPEVKEPKIDAVLKQLKEGVENVQNSQNLRQFLLAMSRFHDYSIGNPILIAIQKPDANRVAGLNTSKELGRYNNHQVHSTTGEVPSVRFARAIKEGKSL